MQSIYNGKLVVFTTEGADSEGGGGVGFVGLLGCEVLCGALFCIVTIIGAVIGAAVGVFEG